MKKTISVLLAVALLVVCLVVPITAADHPFTDVSDNAWYADNVQFVYEKGLMAGTAADKFSPETKMNRAMLVTVLYRMDGSHAASGTTPFTDIQTKEYYYPALVWAYGNGIINGTAPDKFSPEAPITREMMVTIFYRYAQFKGLDVSKTDNLSKYTDAGKISGYAKEPFQWAVAAGVIYGNTETTLNPLGTATRAECAAILQRFYTLANGGSEETEPVKPTEPTPIEPAPTEPTNPSEPSNPVDPVKPTEPSADYSEPVDPSEGETPTEPTNPDPCPDYDGKEEPTECCHAWDHHHEDAEYYTDSWIVCDCGWECHGYDLVEGGKYAGMSYVEAWMQHMSVFPIGVQLDEHGGYKNCHETTLVKEEVNWWICVICGCKVDSDPVNP